MSDIGNSVLLRRVDQFCYVDDLLEAGGGCDLSVTANIGSVQKVSSALVDNPIICCIYSAYSVSMDPLLVKVS